MEFKLTQELEHLARQLRKGLGLLVDNEKYAEFEQITYEQLSEKIKEAFPYITIIDNKVSDTYMIKCNKNESCLNPVDDYFEIYVDKNAQNIDLLMHEVSHVFFHKREIPYNSPIGKDSGTWEQEQEANYFTRAFLIPENYFIKALSIFSRNDGTVNLDDFAVRFKVPRKMIVERGRDLKIW